MLIAAFVADTGHWWGKPDWWVVIVAAFTGIVIAWQSNETRKAASAAFLQINMMKDKERARVEIKALGLELTRVTEEFWHIKTTIEFHNVGAGRAYVRLGGGDFEVTGDGIERDTSYPKTLDIVDGFIDPIGEPPKETFYFFQPDDTALSVYSHGINDGLIGLYLTGFIEYETVGTRYHRNFNYAYVGHGNPLNFGARLTISDEFNPKTDEERVSFGYWSPNSIWMTGRAGGNDEYEMPLKRKEKWKRIKAAWEQLKELADDDSDQES